MRTFTVERQADQSGVSGTGVVMEGVEFTDGTVALRWQTLHRSTVVWENLAEMLAVHIIPHTINDHIIRFNDGYIMTQSAAEEYFRRYQMERLYGSTD